MRSFKRQHLRKQAIRGTEVPGVQGRLPLQQYFRWLGGLQDGCF